MRAACRKSWSELKSSQAPKLNGRDEINDNVDQAIAALHWPNNFKTRKTLPEDLVYTCHVELEIHAD
jgi:hypothetical protein